MHVHQDPPEYEIHRYETYSVIWTLSPVQHSRSQNILIWSINPCRNNRCVSIKIPLPIAFFCYPSSWHLIWSIDQCRNNRCMSIQIELSFSLIHHHDILSDQLVYVEKLGACPSRFSILLSFSLIRHHDILSDQLVYVETIGAYPSILYSFSLIHHRDKIQTELRVSILVCLSCSKPQLGCILFLEWEAGDQCHTQPTQWQPTASP